MTMRNSMIAGVAALALATGTAALAAKGRQATATLTTAAGAPAGTAIAEQVANGVKISFDGKGLPPGTHGIHVHTVGKCDAPAFTTAGGHWNPTQHQHGALNPQGPHAGDLPNLEVGPDGNAILEATLPGTLDGLLDADGAAIVVHAGADDLKSDPAGNSGARIACGVFHAK